jgi:CRISPR-associated endonuclease/helicase Cas3
MHHDTKFFARTDRLSSASPQNASGLRRQPLEDHLAHVAALAASASAWFGSTDWGRLAGLWHDLGKYQEEFQRRLMGEPLAVEHAGVGARLAYEIDPNKGIPLALAFAGHHGGWTFFILC